MEMMSSNTKQHAAILCSAGLGHLIPVLQLAKRLVVHQHDVTLFVLPSPTSKAESELLKAATTPKLFDIIELHPPDISGLVGPEKSVVTLLVLMMRELRHAFRSAVLEMRSRPSTLIVDLFRTESFPVAEELGIPKYVFHASNAWFLSFVVCCPTFDREVKGEWGDHKLDLEITVCRKLRVNLDVIDIMLDRSNQHYDDFVELSGRVIEGSGGILLNMWEELEPTTLAALRDGKLLGRYSKVPVYPIGPLMRPSELSSGPKGNKVFDWLDEQPNDSVIYVSFGSGGALSLEQTTEIAWGLEMSQQKFLWVIRAPGVVTTADADYFKVTHERAIEVLT